MVVSIEISMTEKEDQNRRFIDMLYCTASKRFASAEPHHGNFALFETSSRKD